MNVTGLFRSNKFRVKDDEAFAAWLADYPDIKAVREGEYWRLLTSEDSDTGTLPNYDADKDAAVHIPAEVSRHLAPGQIFIVSEVSTEGCRSLRGWAEAVNHTGESISINLCDIYQLALEKFGVYTSDQS